jgi:electron transfer flavoprotein-quinone oxidoreductase
MLFIIVLVIHRKRNYVKYNTPQMPDYDAIVVGAGNAGSAAAISMASKGLSVLLVDRSDPPGAKNLSGGVLWGNDLAQILPKWQSEAPLERFIDNKKIGFLTEKSSIVIDFKTEIFRENKVGYTVLRSKLDPWMAKKAKEAGATVIPGITVESLVIKDRTVVGVQESGDVITSNVVILAEGINPRLSIEAGLRGPLQDWEVSVGVKEIIKLSPQKIEDRFNLTPNSGMASEYIVGNMGDLNIGAFLYTNKDSISLGIVSPMEELRKNGVTHTYDIIETFKEHPSIAPLIEGGTVAEYGAHLIPEGGLDMVPQVYGNGYMIVGDAAGFAFSNGLVLQGMNYAILSGIVAGQTAVEAKTRNDFTSKSLSAYEEKLQNTYVLKDLKTFKDIRKVTGNKNMYTVYPKMLEGILLEMLWERGQPKKKVRDILGSCATDLKMSRLKTMTDFYYIYRRM